jgi:hypothetical protein
MILKDRRMRPERGEWRAYQNFSEKLDLYPEFDPMPLSSNSAKTIAIVKLSTLKTRL